MIRRAFLVAAVLVLASAGCAAPAAPPGEGEGTMRALRYRQLIVESADDFSHGGGRWHDCLYLPDAGVVCQVVWEWEVSWEPEYSSRDIPRMYAFHGALEDALEARPKDEPQGTAPPEEIRIPASLAREIVALAEAARRQRETSERLAREAVDLRAVGGKDSVAFRAR